MSTEETNGKGQQQDEANERTALIQSSSQSYSTQEQQQQQQQEEEILTSVVDVEAGVATSTLEQEERPIVSEMLMTKTVKKVIRQHRKAQVYISEQSSSSSSSKRVSSKTSSTTVTTPPPVALLQRRGSNTSSSSSSSSNSSSSSSSDEEGNQRVPIGNGHQRVRKRDQIKNALKSATQQWKDKHGWSSSLFLQQQQKDNNQQQQHGVDSSEEPLPPLPVTPLSLPPVEVDIYRVTGVASVCTLLAMAKKNDEKTQRLAISTLHHSIKATAHTRPMILRQVLLRPHLKGLCALEWAVENECHLFLADRLVQSVMHVSLFVSSHLSFPRSLYYRMHGGCMDLQMTGISKNQINTRMLYGVLIHGCLIILQDGLHHVIKHLLVWHVVSFIWHCIWLLLPMLIIKAPIMYTPLSTRTMSLSLQMLCFSSLAHWFILW